MLIPLKQISISPVLTPPNLNFSWTEQIYYHSSDALQSINCAAILPIEKLIPLSHMFMYFSSTVYNCTTGLFCSCLSSVKFPAEMHLLGTFSSLSYFRCLVKTKWHCSPGIGVVYFIYLAAPCLLSQFEFRLTAAGLLLWVGRFDCYRVFDSDYSGCKRGKLPNSAVSLPAHLVQYWQFYLAACPGWGLQINLPPESLYQEMLGIGSGTFYRQYMCDITERCPLICSASIVLMAAKYFYGDLLFYLNSTFNHLIVRHL